MRHFCENSLLICINGFAFAVAIALTKKTLIKSNVTMEISHKRERGELSLAKSICNASELEELKLPYQPKKYCKFNLLKK